MNLGMSVFRDTLVGGMQRKSIVKPSQWSQKYRIMGKPFPGPFSFLHHPWLKDMHDSTNERNVGQKAAQMGFTELLINLSFFANDILKESVLYLLPTADEASDFSATRFDPALELSFHLSQLYNDVKNISTKRAGGACLFIRGSRSRSKLKSLPAGWIMVDERDEMRQDMVRLALERASGQETKRIWEMSTPSVELFGINKEFEHSSQEHFFFRCPHCSRFTELLFPDCLIITGDSPYEDSINNSHLICKECKHILDHNKKIEFLQDYEWVPGRTNTNIRGFHISQMYSMTVTPVELAIYYLRSQVDPVEEQEFWNSKLGLPHVVAGAKIGDKDIEDCIGKHGNKLTKPDGLITMGIDVGTNLHFWIDQWVNDKTDSIGYRPRTIYVDKVKHFGELDKILVDFRINKFVIDRNPERRKSDELTAKYNGLGYSCLYTQGNAPRTIQIDEQENVVKVDRTSWLDASLGRVHNRHISLPIDLEFEAKEHLKNLTRIVKKNDLNEPIGSYVNTGADHWAHARNYSEIAFHLALGHGQTKDIN
jgi:hypothetical protein